MSGVLPTSVEDSEASLEAPIAVMHSSTFWRVVSVIVWRFQRGMSHRRNHAFMKMDNVLLPVIETTITSTAILLLATKVARFEW